MRRRNESFSASMDSLLDTMTNVVGILVILLVVTQLGVRSAVNRIRSSLPEISVQQHEEAQRVAQQRAAELQRLEGLRSQGADAEAKLRTELTALQQRVKQLESGMPAPSATTPAALQQSLAATTKSVSELQPRVSALEEEVAKLSVDLEASKQKKGIPAEVVRLPDPRQPPPNAQAEYFYCRHGRIVYIDRAAAAKVAAQRLSFMRNQLRHDTTKSGLGGGLQKGKRLGGKIGQSSTVTNVELNRTKCLEYFRKTHVMFGDHRLYLAAQDVHNVCWVVMEVSTRRGATARSVVTGQTRIRSTFLNIKRQGNYARFIVHPDSFEVYLKARAVAHQIGVPAGWVLFGNNEWNTGQIVQGIRLHRDKQPPPPDPNRKPPKPQKVLD